MAVEMKVLCGRVRRSSSRTFWLAIRRTGATILLAALLVCGPQRAHAQTAPAPFNYRAAENGPSDTKSATELNKEVSNPISSIWPITFQEDIYWLNSRLVRVDRNMVVVDGRDGIKHD